ncbi:MAG: sulfatase [Thermodesulfobacteriota bacterium]
MVKSITLISNNKYFAYKLNNLILFDIQENITTYTIIGLLISIFIAVLLLASKRILHAISCLNLSPKNKLVLLTTCIIAIIIIIGFSYIYYLDIIIFLKSTNATSWLARLSSSKKDTYFIFIQIVALLSIYVIVLISYIIWQNLIGNISRTILDKINLSIIKTLGIAIIIILLSFNVFMFGYKKLNSPEGPNIVLITIDTLRADHLGVYGHERNTSPSIDKLAEKGVLFENAISQASWTLPSMASMHTSLYPSEAKTSSIKSNVRNELLTLPEYMKNNFYNTIAVISNIVVSKVYGFSQGFNIFNQEHIAEVNELSAELITNQAVEYISQNKDSKFFLWVHYFDPHHNYKNHTEYDYGDEYSGNLPDNLDNEHLNNIKSSLNEHDLEYIRNIYDEEISYNDKYVGELIDAINNLGLAEDTVIILTSDHGEEFMERSKLGHGGTLYQELIHVPLIIYDPLDASTMGKRVKEHVEIRSIAKTISELSGFEENPFEGINLLNDEEISPENIVIAEVYGVIEGNKKETVIRNNWKLIDNLNSQTFELYKIDDDFGESTNLYSKDKKEINIQKEKLQAILSLIYEKDLKGSAEAELSNEDIKQLKALGYIQ